MQYIPFQLLISVILTSRDIESCITFLLSFEYLLAAISTSVSDRIQSVIMLYIGYNALYWIMCAVVGAYLIGKCVCFELGLLPPRVLFIQTKVPTPIIYARCCLVMLCDFA